MRRTLLAGVACLGLLFPVMALSGPVTDSEAALRDAYGQYRAALFLSNSGNAEGTGKALQALTETWAGLRAAWEALPPPQYADDPEFDATLATVSEIVDGASAKVAAGDLPGAHASLEEVRAQLSALHVRNGVFSFSDRMNAYHAKMEAVLAAGYAAQPDSGLGAMREDAAVLMFLADDIAAHPAPNSGIPEYAPLLAAFVASAAAFQDAARAGDVVAAKAAIAGLKVPYSKFFLKFG